METGKPLISILMAVYEPRLDWLREQLGSLEAQTYPNLRLYIRDDCSTTVPFEEIEGCVQDCIRSFPYEITRNEKNLGSNLTFERLTREAEGEYFAYCDQDDIWLPEKLERLSEAFQSSRIGLVYSDVIPIDQNGVKIADSIASLRRRHVFYQGAGLASVLIYNNFVIGCTMMIRSQIARSAVPFVNNMVHDHYLALHCAVTHEISVCGCPLVRYRQHANNQTGVLVNIHDKQSYIALYIDKFRERIQELSHRLDVPELCMANQWAEARIRNAKHQPGGAKALWCSRRANRAVSLFEIIGLRLPVPCFAWVVKLIQRGII